MGHLIAAIRAKKILWLLVIVPLPLLAERMAPASHTLVFLLSAAAIVPLAALLSYATEQVAERTGDAIGGLLNATLGNLTELIIAITALAAGEYLLVKSSIAGAIISNTLFMMGASFLIGGLRHKVQTFNAANARLQIALLFVSAFALLVPSAIASADARQLPQDLSLLIAVILIATYVLGLFFTLGTHKSYFDAARAAEPAAGDERHGVETHELWPVGVATGVLLGTTVIVALVSEAFVASLSGASESLGLSPAFVGIVIVAIVGAAAEMVTAFAAAAKDRLDLSVGIAFGSAAQIALFVAPVLVLLSYVVGPEPMGLEFWPGAVVMILFSVATAALVTAGGHSAWFLGVVMLVVYLILAVTLYVMPVAAPAQAAATYPAG